MLRGVNKQIIELNECNSEMFYKAILYVRPEYFDKKPEELQKEGEIFISTAEYLKDVSPIFPRADVKKMKKAKSRRMFFVGAGAVFSVIIASIFLLIK